MIIKQMIYKPHFERNGRDDGQNWRVLAREMKFTLESHCGAIGLKWKSLELLKPVKNMFK